VAAILLAHFLLGQSAAWNKSNAFDETAHLVGGYSYWHTGDLRLNREAGILPQLWAALPLTFMPVEWLPADSVAWARADLAECGRQFLFEANHRVMSMLHASRAMIGAISLLLGWCVYRTSRARFGRAAGWLSLALYAFSPTMLAHSALVTSDLAAALALFAGTLAIWRVMQFATEEAVTPRFVRRAIGAGLIVAAALMSKVTALLLLPISAVLAAILGWILFHPSTDGTGPIASPAPIRAWLRAAGAAFFVAIIACGGLCTVYAAFSGPLERIDPTPGSGELTFQAPEPSQDAGMALRLVRIAQDWRLLPANWLKGVAFMLDYSASRPAFLRGRYSLTGWWWFFPYCFAVKTPLPLLAMIVLAAIAWVRIRRAGTSFDRSLAPLLVLLVVYWGFAVMSPLNIGHRHLLPVYPPLFVLCGSLLAVVPDRGATRSGDSHAPASTRGQFAPRLNPAMTISLVVWFVIESMWMRPNYLACFNAFAGGPDQGWRCLVDSSLDWGQELPALRDWLAQRGDENGSAKQPIHLCYFGSGEPEAFDIHAARLPGYGDTQPSPPDLTLRGGLYCISATMLQSVYTPLMGHWCERYERDYQTLLAGPDGGATESAAKRRAFLLQMQTARLCAALRQRFPTAQINHALLVFELTDSEVTQALFGPPAELQADPMAPSAR